MASEIYIVDAFTDKAFSGNPAGVCFVDSLEFNNEEFMQNVAFELNLSETAFLLPNGISKYDIRFFTPTVEIDLCGHATLASAHILFSETLVEPECVVTFNTKVGEVKVSLASGDIALNNGELLMNFPLDEFKEDKCPDGLYEALGITGGFRGIGKSDLIVELNSIKELKILSPDFDLLSKVNTRIIIVTAKYDDKLNFDYGCRIFGPSVGINEDPVTGGVQPLLASFWALKFGKKDFFVHQLSQRGGKLNVSLTDDSATIKGRAVTIIKGDLVVN